MSNHFMDMSDLQDALNQVDTLDFTNVEFRIIVDAARRVANPDLREQLYEAIRTGTRRSECNLAPEQIRGGVDAVLAALGIAKEKTR